MLNKQYKEAGESVLCLGMGNRSMIKKALLIAAAMAAVCVSCGKSKDTDITGTWRISDESFNGGYIFNEDGTGGVYIYPDDMYFSDGALFISGTRFGSDNLKYDGDILQADILGQTALVLDRTGEPLPESYDGEYLLTGGSYRESIALGMGVESAEAAEILISIEGERIKITAAHTIDYTFDGDKLSLKGHNGFPDSSGKAELKGNKLTVERVDGGERLLIKE